MPRLERFYVHIPFTHSYSPTRSWSPRNSTTYRYTHSLSLPSTAHTSSLPGRLHCRHVLVPDQWGAAGGGGGGQTRWLYEIFSPGPYMRTSFKYPVALGTELVPSFKPGKS